MADKMTFFESYYEAIMLIENPADRLKLFEAICGYGIKGKLPDDFDGIAKVVFTAIKPTIDNSIRNRSNGENGGRPKKENEVGDNGGYYNSKTGVLENKKPPFENEKAPFSEVEKPPFENCESDKDKDRNRDKDKDRDRDKKTNTLGSEGEKPKSRFVPPTVEEVAAYCAERGNGIDAEEFVAHYGSVNWMVGKAKMSNWKQAIVTWEKKRGFKYTKPKVQQPKSPPKDPNAGLEKRNLDDPTDDARHPFEDGWRINNDGYWIRI